VITYYSDTSPLKDPEAYRLAYSKVPSRRRDKTDQFAFDKDRRLSLGVELLLMRALEDLGEDPDTSRMDLTGNGKPVLAGSRICFNLSHSGERVMCSVSDADVGCDVEKIEPIDLELAHRFFYNSEYDAISKEEGIGRDVMFYRFWTLKESFMKATGLGFELDLDSFCIDLSDGISVDQHVDGRAYRFKEYDPGDGYRCAVCSVNGDFEPEMRRTDLSELVRRRPERPPPCVSPSERWTQLPGVGKRPGDTVNKTRLFLENKANLYNQCDSFPSL
jgi:4'-phosphopantetheinyl transferase